MGRPSERPSERSSDRPPASRQIREGERIIQLDEAGTSPGSLVIDPSAAAPILDLTVFDGDHLTEKRIESVAEVKPYLDKGRGVVWLNIDGVGNAEVITEIGKLFDLHRLTLEDVTQVHQRPKVEVFRGYVFVVVRMVFLEGALETEQLLKEQYSADMEIKRLIDLALQLEGLFRNASTHAAGVVIGDRPLDELVPLYRDTDSKDSLPATQFNMKWVETAGLVKFDFLGLKTLTVIEKACEISDDSLREEYGVSLKKDARGRKSRSGFTVLGMGKLGGGELNFSSDVDLMFLYASDAEESGSLDAATYFRRLSQKITQGLSSFTGEGYIYRVDLRLRPEGKAGNLADALSGYRRYYEKRLAPWERLALIYAILGPPVVLLVLIGLMAVEGDYTESTRMLRFSEPIAPAGHEAEAAH